jgi:hypothetical protein
MTLLQFGLAGHSTFYQMWAITKMIFAGLFYLSTHWVTTIHLFHKHKA